MGFATLFMPSLIWGPSMQNDPTRAPRMLPPKRSETPPQVFGQRRPMQPPPPQQHQCAPELGQRSFAGKLLIGVLLVVLLPFALLGGLLKSLFGRGPVADPHRPGPPTQPGQQSAINNSTRVPIIIPGGLGGNSTAQAPGAGQNSTRVPIIIPGGIGGNSTAQAPGAGQSPGQSATRGGFGGSASAHGGGGGGTGGGG
jgi:hypothetical protein